MKLINGPIIQQVNHILSQAIDLGASDIHLEPMEKTLRVRYRLDGVLKTVGLVDLSQTLALISRVKIMASLDIAEKRRPQDGRIRYEYGSGTIDIRISVLPTVFGEKVVLRILDKSNLVLDFGALGFNISVTNEIISCLDKPNGIILVTGPTGSGKTTTLYTILNHLNKEGVNITTIEDPIEYNLDGINQTQVHQEIGLDFAQALRSILRQDPDVIMVGEIRDAETAQIAIRASLTGHLVISTLHTNDVVSTLTRLLDMGIEPFLLGSSIRLILAQRLVRKICKACGGLINSVNQQECEFCHGTGYKGRTTVTEHVIIDEGLKPLISSGCDESLIKSHLNKHSFISLSKNGKILVESGVTSIKELIREGIN